MHTCYYHKLLSILHVSMAVALVNDKSMNCISTSATWLSMRIESLSGHINSSSWRSCNSNIIWVDILRRVLLHSPGNIHLCYWIWRRENIFGYSRGSLRFKDPIITHSPTSSPLLLRTSLPSFLFVQPGIQSRIWWTVEELWLNVHPKPKVLWLFWEFMVKTERFSHANWFNYYALYCLFGKPNIQS